MKAGRRFPRHFAARHGMPCGRLPPPRQPVRGKACKRTNGFCTRTASNQKEKAVRSPVFPRFPHSREFLCGKKFASLRQETNFFQQRNPVFAAQKRPPGRRNVPYGRFSRPFLCTDAINRVSTVPLHGRGIRGKPSILIGNVGFWRQNDIRTNKDFPNGIPPSSKALPAGDVVIWHEKRLRSFTKKTLYIRCNLSFFPTFAAEIL